METDKGAFGYGHGAHRAWQFFTEVIGVSVTIIEGTVFEMEEFGVVTARFSRFCFEFLEEIVSYFGFVEFSRVFANEAAAAVCYTT